MCEEISCNIPWMLWTAAGFFEAGGAFEPLRKLTCKPADFPSRASNIAWDVVHYMGRRGFAGWKGRDGAFLVPYTLTCDLGLAQLFDNQPQRSCLVFDDGSFPPFFADRDIHVEVIERYPSAMKAAQRHFTLEGNQIRAERLKRDGPRDYTPLLTDLIKECQRRS